MKHNKPMVVPYHRKKTGKTNYKKRLKLLLSQKPRLVVRKTNKLLIGQIVEYHPDGDKVLLTLTSQALAKYGWMFSKKNIPAAYLTGLMLGTKAKEKKIKEAILDFGFSTSVKGSRVYALLKGVVDAGLQVPHNDKILPSEDRLTGKHISTLMSQTQGRQFSKYKKESKNPEQSFIETKQKIMKV